MTDDLLKLPADLADSYEVVSCLKHAEDNAVYRICRKRDGMPYILKTASGPFYAGLLTNEENILSFIHAFEDSWHSEMFPTVVSLSRDEATDTVYYIRSYIEGKTLEELCETNLSMPGIPLRQTLDYLIVLTDQLRFLHAMNPPLIHRDIKPQNIVVDPEGGCHFIDLGIARFFQPEKRGDTLIMGTQLTAPPEQFGYQQCDTRSDLYSLGILFYYCLTGEYQASENLLSTLDASAASVIRRATMFDPANRYQKADDMLADLLAIRYPHVSDFCSSGALSPHAVGQSKSNAFPGQDAGTSSGETPTGRKTEDAHAEQTHSSTSLTRDESSHRHFSWLSRIASTVLTVLITIAVIFAILRLSQTGSPSTVNSGTSESDFAQQTESTVADSAQSLTDDLTQNSVADSASMQGAASSEYTFAEPLIEEAVRKQLNIADTDPVTEADLEKVVSLHIFGLQIYSSDEEIYFQGAYPYVYTTEMRESGLYEQTGTISSLEDITHMPNLRTLCLYRQQITDISVLADENLEITELGLGYNPLTDLSPLTGNDTIVYLNLADFSISDDAVTEVISTMSSLQTLNISSTDIRSLNGLENCPITDLNIYEIELDGYMELTLLEGLTDLEISYLTGSIVQAFSGLPLESLIVHNPNGYSLEVFSVLTDLEYICVHDPYMDTITFGQMDLPSLKTLEIKNTVITDFYDLAALGSLSTLMIYSCECESYDGLDELSGLKTICCTEEQANAIRAEYPDVDYFYSY